MINAKKEEASKLENEKEVNDATERVNVLDIDVEEEFDVDDI